MKYLLALACALALTACGGGEDAQPAAFAQCNGTPTRAVVYVGDSAYPELQALPDACVYGTSDPQQFETFMQRAKADAHVQRVYSITTGTDVVLRYRQTHSDAEVSSLWFVPADAPTQGINGSIITINLNAGPSGAAACQATAQALVAQGTVAVCHVQPTDAFGPSERTQAIAQLF